MRHNDGDPIRGDLVTSIQKCNIWTVWYEDNRAIGTHPSIAQPAESDCRTDNYQEHQTERHSLFNSTSDQELGVDFLVNITHNH